jgi:predicted dehydrogenase
MQPETHQAVQQNSATELPVSRHEAAPNIRAGIVGMGAIARHYLNAFHEELGFDLLAVCDRDERQLESARQLGLDVIEDFHDLLRLVELDAVVICLPNDMHYRACKAAILAGKHVCCEKPLAFTVAEAEQLVELARQHRRTLMTSLHRRYNANVLAAKATVGNRRVTHIDARYLEKIEDHSGSDTWYLDAARCGGGCIADNGPNVFDTLSLFISNLVVVACHIDEHRSGVDLRARIRLQGDGGATADVTLDWAYEGEQKDLNIHLEDGQQIRADMLAGFTGFKSSLDHEYVAILADFKQRIIENHFAGNEGVRAVQLVEAAYQTASEASADVRSS